MININFLTPIIKKKKKRNNEAKSVYKNQNNTKNDSNSFQQCILLEHERTFL